MSQSKEIAVDKLPKVQRLVYDAIKACRRLTLGGIASLVKKEKRNLSSALTALQKKELIVLKDHYFYVTTNKTFKSRTFKTHVDTVESLRDRDPEHAEWLQNVLKLKAQKLLRIQLAKHL